MPTSFVVRHHDIVPIPITKKGISSLFGNKNDLVTAIEEKELKERLKKIKLNLKNIKRKKKLKGKREKSKGTNRALLKDFNESDVSDADCMFCEDYFSKSRENEGWIRCLRWAHEACSGCEDENNEFICDLCK